MGGQIRSLLPDLRVWPSQEAVSWPAAKWLGGGVAPSGPLGRLLVGDGGRTSALGSGGRLGGRLGGSGSGGGGDGRLGGGLLGGGSAARSAGGCPGCSCGRALTLGQTWGGSAALAALTAALAAVSAVTAVPTAVTALALGTLGALATLLAVLAVDGSTLGGFAALAALALAALTILTAGPLPWALRVGQPRGEQRAEARAARAVLALGCVPVAQVT